VLGSRGFIGSHLMTRLLAASVELTMPRKGEDLSGQDLGYVYDCAGLTADFRQRPVETVEAHVTLLNTIVRSCRFDGLLYLSSTRVYADADSAGEEISLVVNPGRPDDLYNISKLLGEAVCLATGRAEVKVARLSNVIGVGMPRDNFVASLVVDAVRDGKITFRTAPESCKDYIAIDDVIDLLLAIANRGTQAIYNVASGRNTTNREIAELIKDRTACGVEFLPSGPKQVFPVIDTSRIQTEFGFSPRPLGPAIDAEIRSLLDREEVP